MTGNRKLGTAVLGIAAIVALAAAATLSAAIFSGSFHRYETITMKVDRAGLLMSAGSDVKYHGVVVGRVAGLEYEDRVAVITMEISPDQLSSIPENVSAAITPSTLFGRKFVELKPRGKEAFTALKAGAVIDATSSALEVNDLFADLLGVLERVDADKVNDTLYAVSTGLQGKGAALGDLLVTLNKYLSTFNGSLPTMERDMRKFAVTTGTLADASPALLKILDNVQTTEKTLTDNRSQLGAFLLSFTRFGNSGNRLMTRAGAPLYWAADGLAPVSKLLSTYSPTYPCFFAALDRNRRYLERGMGGARAGLNAQGTLLAGDPPYRYPTNLPTVTVNNAPSCYGSSETGEIHRAPGHTDFDDGSQAYRQGNPLVGADLAYFLFGARR